MAVEVRGRVRIEESDKRVRAFLGGVPIADTIRPRLVWEIPYYPAYYIPAGDVRMDMLRPSTHTDRSPSRGEARFFSVVDGEKVAHDAAWQYPDSQIEALRDLMRFDWDAMDAWFEEDEQVYTHPRDPHHRVDILSSSRHVEVLVNGMKVADSRSPRLLFETSLPTRYYLPLVDIRMDLLRPSRKSTGCAYKGTASYWSLAVGDELVEDVVWSYPTPLPEGAKIAGLASFYNERVDIVVDGVLQERPVTQFGPRPPSVGTVASTGDQE